MVIATILSNVMLRYTFFFCLCTTIGKSRSKISIAINEPYVTTRSDVGGERIGCHRWRRNLSLCADKHAMGLSFSDRKCHYG